MPSNEVTVRVHLRVTPKRSIRRNIFLAVGVLVVFAFLNNVFGPKPNQIGQNQQTQRPIPTTNIVAQIPTQDTTEPTPTPTEEPTPEPILEPTPEPTPIHGVELANGPIPNGSSLNLPENSVIEGDVFVNGQKMYDGLDSTGLIIVLTQPATVSVDPAWGASYQTYSDYETAENVAQNTFKPSMLNNNGCGSTCADVAVIDWPGNSQ